MEASILLAKVVKIIQSIDRIRHLTCFISVA